MTVNSQAEAPVRRRGEGGEQRVVAILGHPGIGDALWHLPVIQAISRHCGAPITVFARRSTHADQVLAGEPGIAKVVLFERRRGMRWPFAFPDMVLKLHAGHYRQGYVLHRRMPFLAAPLFAGIPERFGLRGSAQHPFINRGPLEDADPTGDQDPLTTCRRFLAASGVALHDATPRLSPDPARRAAVLRRFEDAARPWIVLGCAVHEDVRKWIPSRFGQLAQACRARWGGTVFLLAGPADSDQVDEVTATLAPDAAILNLARDPLALRDVIALLAESDVFVGNDSGPLNLAAAVGTPAWGLFGHAAPHASLSPRIKAILPCAGPPDRVTGMQRIAASQVLELIAADVEAGGR